ncbi:fatty-acyl-CoA synthase [Myxococcus fulvus]|uniref:Fatty-acyl-CoA synthase n=1 Tax=Myxococcus fulvus TaxID=33 RepID=A0A511T1M5_MYXFU|nr:long-chain fatty acid--CoA ligase [Myxococcus fulvus]GEN07278.1 long-chain-fatty-acid--CoA ligase [Myxococcus fulvus]SET96493.1 fatty-acyl-CoA synthase [Myxococcus fulvus]
MLPGRMMDFPLTLTHFLERARTYYPRSEIVSRNPDKSMHRYTYADFYQRTCRLMNALKRLGVKAGDRVATLSWNHYRHLEAYFGIPAMGAVVHTLNLRLHPNDLAYIARHAEDTVVLVDRSLWPLFEKFAAQVPSLRHVIVIPDAGPAPEGTLDYEKLLAAEPETFDFPTLDENSAAMLCYTSGTTGNPKGVLFSHRSITLHTLVCCMKDLTGIGEADSVLPVVPMFHAAAWGLPFDALLTGARMVMPGPHLDPPSLLELMATEKVTVAGGVPTIWLGILALLDQDPKKWDLSAMRTMLIGGSAAPPAMIDGFRQRHGLEVTHAWGMTEMNPVGTMAKVKQELRHADAKAQLGAQSSQGFALPFVETRVMGEDGKALPWDGATMGELEVRGPWVAGSYYGGEGADRFTADGWFKTGDVVTLDADGYVRICDRSKDVIKSGGEWISSVALENALMSHPAVLEAAVFAGRHARWDERPLAAVVLKPGQAASKEALTEHLAKQFAKFWLPDDYLFIEQIPRTSTGKFLKTKLREDYGDHLIKNPSTAAG